MAPNLNKRSDWQGRHDHPPSPFFFPMSSLSSRHSSRQGLKPRFFINFAVSWLVDQPHCCCFFSPRIQPTRLPLKPGRCLQCVSHLPPSADTANVDGEYFWLCSLGRHRCNFLFFAQHRPFLVWSAYRRIPGFKWLVEVQHRRANRSFQYHLDTNLREIMAVFHLGIQLVVVSAFSDDQTFAVHFAESKEQY